MRQPGKFRDDLQHRRHFQAQEFARGQRCQRIRPVMQADHGEFAGSNQQRVASGQVLDLVIDANAILAVIRFIEAKRDDPVNVRGALGRFLVGAIDDRGVGFPVDAVLGLPVFVLVHVPIEMIRRNIEQHGYLGR